MSDPNPYAPPRSEGPFQARRSVAFIAAPWLWVLVVLLQSAFSAHYSTFLFHLASIGVISVLHFGAMVVASSLLALGGLLFVVRVRARFALVGAVLFAAGAISLGVWYHMLSSVVIALAGLLIEVRGQQSGSNGT